MAGYIFARFEAIEPTRAEPGRVRINLFASIGEQSLFFIHSEWLDEAAFEAHTSSRTR